MTFKKLQSETKLKCFPAGVVLGNRLIELKCVGSLCDNPDWIDRILNDRQVLVIRRRPADGEHDQMLCPPDYLYSNMLKELDL